MSAGIGIGRGAAMAVAGALSALLAMFALAPATAAAVGEPKGPVEVADGVFLTSATGLDRDAAARSSRSRRASPRIVGGSKATVAQYPWQASLTYNLENDDSSGFGRHLCGASLITPTLAVTAAHCLYDEGFPPAGDFALITGRTRLSTSEGQESALADYYLFTDASNNTLYDPGSQRWDVAIVRLAVPSQATPIQVAGADERALWTTGREAVVSGWGLTSEDGIETDTLRAVTVSMVDDASCAGAYGGGAQTDVMVCAGAAGGGRDSCEGDSGGPLVAPTADGWFRLVGVVSFGKGCARPEFPGVYARVADDPIRSALRNAVLGLGGVDVVGSGATPGAVPPMGPPAPSCLSVGVAVNDAEKSLRKAKRKLKKVEAKKKAGKKAKRKAKKAVKKAKKSVKKAKAALADSGC